MYLYIMSLCGALVCILSFLELFPSYQTAVSAWDACRRPGGPPDNAMAASLGAITSTRTPKSRTYPPTVIYDPGGAGGGG